ncbi:hypothetical protein QOT17_022794 [Balamuthia mandrillaris]
MQDGGTCFIPQLGRRNSTRIFPSHSALNSTETLQKVIPKPVICPSPHHHLIALILRYKYPSIPLSLVKQNKTNKQPTHQTKQDKQTTQQTTMKCFSMLVLLALLATLNLALAQEQPPANNCRVKVVHLLQGGSPIDVRVGEQLVAANLAFLRSQTSQPNVPCGLQNVQLFASGMQGDSFRSENFALAEGENVINYIVFGGELREPANTNVFLLSHEPVAIPQTEEGTINMAFWHYAPVVRLEQVQLDVLNGNETVLSAIANFQQRTNYMTIPSADALTFRFSDLALEELLTATRSVAALRNSGAGTVFALGANATELFLDADPAILVSSDGTASSESSSSSSGPVNPPPTGDGDDVSESSSAGSVSLGSQSSEEDDLTSNISFNSFLY